ncbi:hypothetical protein KUTeg_010476 [Tegillarca granosa]|uniref:Thioredoxin-like fold domain-containing protein n=1 Tax=Tegillarca granosa TaxID=220873 RepID=A0ABQ9F6T5_TEGGR|nr:hypothetical protein KUTeg_010476 [Tegillarca granosa]
MLFKLLLILVITTRASCQLPIPKRPVGFVYNGGDADAPVHFDIYMGPLCSDSKTVYPTIIRLADSYGPRTLRLTTHLFPLPFHRNAYLAAMGQHVVDEVTQGNMSYAWMSEVYSHLDTLSNTATADMTENQVKQKFSRIARNVGGVANAPTFMINDVVVDADLTWTVDDWKQIIDPLLEPDQTDIDIPNSIAD